MTNRTVRGTTLALASAALLALTACSSATSSDPSSGQPQGGTPEEQSTSLLNMVLDPTLPGCSVAVAEEGKVVWADAVGIADLSSGTPLTTSTAFDFASISKHITGMAILLLVADGEVSLDASVATYLPDAGPWAATTTVEQLLHQTSGLPDYLDILEGEGLTIADSVTQAQAMASLDDVITPAESQPWEYSNSNYVALADIVAAVSGQSFADFVQERLFTPEHSSLVVDPLAAYPDIASRYHARSTDSTALTVGVDIVGDGAVMGTPTAMAEWLDVMRTGLPGYPAIADAMVADAVEMPDMGGMTYGAGLFVAADGFVWHTGGWEGHASYMIVSADRSTSIALACNSDELDMEMPSIIQGITAIWFGSAE